MSTLTELLAEARRRALLTGTPLSSSEMTGITDAAAAGAGQRVALKQRLLEEKKRIAREKKMAKQAMATQERNDKIEGMGNVYQIDQMTGKHLSNATGGYGTDLIKTGATKLADMTGASPYIRSATNKLGSLTGGLIGTTPAAASGIIAPAFAAPMQAGLSSIANAVGNTGGSLAANAVNQAAMNSIAKGTGSLGAQVAAQVAPKMGAMGLTGTGTGAPAVASTAPALTTGLSGTTLGTVAGPAGVAGSVGGVLGGQAGQWAGGKLGIGGQQERESVGSTLGGAVGGAVTGAALTSWSGPGAIAGGAVGGLVGLASSLVKKICFAIGTPVTMEDGTERKIEELRLYDNMKEGGSVWGTGTCLSEDMWNYKGLFVSGEHAVLENGQWVRISQSEHGRKLTIDEPMVVVPIANENHVMIVNGMVFSDYAETDHGTDVNDAFRLDYMNSETDKINYLMDKYELRAAA